MQVQCSVPVTQSICELQNVSVAQDTIDKRIYKHFDFMKLLIMQKPCKMDLLLEKFMQLAQLVVENKYSDLVRGIVHLQIIFAFGFQLGQPTFSAFYNVFIGEGHNLGLAFLARQKSFYGFHSLS